MISTISSNSPLAAAGGTDSSDFIKKMFAKIDSDGDGKVTQDEFVTALEKRLGKTGTDNNASDAAAIFKKVDGDGDGAISSSEFETAFKAAKSQRGAPPPPPPGPPPSDGGQDDSSKVFDALDTNKDGTVSLDELKAALTSKAADKSSVTGASGSDDLKSLFDSIDSDGDGAVTESELKEMLEKLKEKAPPPPPPEALYSLDGSTTSGTAGAGVFLNKLG